MSMEPIRPPSVAAASPSAATPEHAEAESHEPSFFHEIQGHIKVLVAIGTVDQMSGGVVEGSIHSVVHTLGGAGKTVITSIAKGSEVSALAGLQGPNVAPVTGAAHTAAAKVTAVHTAVHTASSAAGSTANTAAASAVKGTVLHTVTGTTAKVAAVKTTAAAVTAKSVAVGGAAVGAGAIAAAAVAIAGTGALMYNAWSSAEEHYAQQRQKSRAAQEPQEVPKRTLPETINIPKGWNLGDKKIMDSKYGIVGVGESPTDAELHFQKMSPPAKEGDTNFVLIRVGNEMKVCFPGKGALHLRKHQSISDQVGNLQRQIRDNPNIQFNNDDLRASWE